jgi:nucleoside-diphosphate-sugar epimerase
MLIATGALRPDALTGQVAVVTGAGGGIGFEAARALLWLGARVVIAEIDESSGSGAARRLRQEWPDSDVLFIATDVGDEAAVGRLVETTRAQLGPIDIVLNNAAVVAVGEAVVGTPIADWDRSYAVNLRGPVPLARACLPSMISRGRGTFVCVSSTGGPFLGSYESLAAALGRSVSDPSELPPLEKLAGFYGHLADLARGYVKDLVERDAQAAVVSGWRAEVEQLRLALTSQS